MHALTSETTVESVIRRYRTSFWTFDLFVPEVHVLGEEQKSKLIVARLFLAAVSSKKLLGAKHHNHFGWLKTFN